jgi:hypothetical protein
MIRFVVDREQREEVTHISASLRERGFAHYLELADDGEELRYNILDYYDIHEDDISDAFSELDGVIVEVL